MPAAAACAQPLPGPQSSQALTEATNVQHQTLSITSQYSELATTGGPSARAHRRSPGALDRNYEITCVTHSRKPARHGVMHRGWLMYLLEERGDHHLPPSTARHLISSCPGVLCTLYGDAVEQRESPEQADLGVPVSWSRHIGTVHSVHQLHGDRFRRSYPHRCACQQKWIVGGTVTL
jgi:hypothetical protein